MSSYNQAWGHPCLLEKDYRPCPNSTWVDSNASSSRCPIGLLVKGASTSQYLGPKSHSDPPVWSYCFLLIPTLNVWGNKTSFVGQGVLSLLWPCHSSSFLSNWSVPSVPLHTAISPRRLTAPPETVSRAFVCAVQKLLHRVSSNSE